MSKFVNLLNELRIQTRWSQGTPMHKKGRPLRIQFPQYMPFGVSGFHQKLDQRSTRSISRWRVWWRRQLRQKILRQCANSKKIIDAVENKASTSSNAKYPKMNSKVCSFQTSRIPDREPKFCVKINVNMDGKIKPRVRKKTQSNVDCKNGLYSRNSGTAIVRIGTLFLEQKVRGNL